MLVFIGKEHRCRATVVVLEHYLVRNHKVLLVTDETKVIRHVEDLPVRFISEKKIKFFC